MAYDIKMKNILNDSTSMEKISGKVWNKFHVPLSMDQALIYIIHDIYGL